VSLDELNHKRPVRVWLVSNDGVVVFLEELYVVLGKILEWDWEKGGRLSVGEKLVMGSEEDLEGILEVVASTASYVNTIAG